VISRLFGVWDPPNAAPGQFTGGILPPPSGLSAQLLSLPQHVPGGLREALIRALIFAGIRMMSGRFQDAIPGLFGALFGAGVLGWGAGWIGSLTGQSM